MAEFKAPGQPRLNVSEAWLLVDGQVEALADWIKLTGDAMLLAAGGDLSAEALMRTQQRRVALHSIASLLVMLKTQMQKEGTTHGQ